MTSQVAGLIAYGMQLSVICTEDVPFITAADVDRVRETFMRDVRIREAARACAEWPRGSVPATWRSTVEADTPILLISGERDPVTPPEIAQRVAAGLPHSRLIVIPSGGHIQAHPCIGRVVAEFLAAGNADGLDITCIASIAPPPFE